MKFLILAVTIATSLPAMAMISSQDLTCKEANAMVVDRGAVLFATGGGHFERYVSTAPFCGAATALVPAWIPTSDSAQCFVGYTCEAGSNGNSN